MAEYWSPQGLVAISKAESGQQNIPQNVSGVPYCPLGNCGSGASSASGYYQMIDGTYATGATNAGLTPVDNNIAMNDTPFNQALAAGNVPVTNWTNFSSADAALLNNPANVQSSPITAQQLTDFTGGGGTLAGDNGLTINAPSDFTDGSTTDNGNGFTLPNPLGAGAGDQIPSTTGSNSPYGLPDVTGATVATPSQFWQHVENFIGQGVLRIGVAILALILIAAAAFAFAHHDPNLKILANAIKSNARKVTA